MDPVLPQGAQPSLDYGRSRPASWRRTWRLLRRIFLWSLPAIVYVLLYVSFARRAGFFGGLYAVSYPGAVRFYALSNRAAESLGQSDESIERGRDAGMTVRRFDDSLYHSNAKWYSGLWRAFYPLERLELQLRGGSVVPIHYPGVAVSAQVAADPKQLPLAGLVYREWFIRGGRLYRFIGAEYGGRSASHELEKRTDIYLFEWDLTVPFEPAPRSAARVRCVDSTRRIAWDEHWLVDADWYLTWDKNSGRVSLLQFAGERQPARVVATLQGVRPVRCNVLSPISVSRSGQFFAAEDNGLFVFDARTLARVHQIKETAALAQFFAARTDELDNTNSQCFLTDDGNLLVRVIETFKSSGDTIINSTSAAVYDINADRSRVIPLNIGTRTDVKDVERVDGALQFYLQSTTTGKKWPHQIVDEKLHSIVTVGPPSTHSGLERFGWEPSSARLVELPGFTANPQPLDLDSEIQVQDAHTGRSTIGRIRYADSSGQPKLFTPGIMKLSHFGP